MRCVCEGFQREYWNGSRVVSAVHASDSIGPHGVLMQQKGHGWISLMENLQAIKKACDTPDSGESLVVDLKVNSNHSP